MIERFSELARGLSDQPLLQGLLAAFSTFIFEDPTTVGCGLLVADGKMAFTTALLGVGLGITLGDLGLYGIGRLLGPKVVKWGIVSRGKMRGAHQWFEKNLIAAVLVSRFLPGMRIPVFMGSGVFAASFWKFLSIALTASFLWTLLLLYLTTRLGRQVLPLLGNLKWPAAVLLLVLLILMMKNVAVAGTRALDNGASEHEEPSPVSRFEFWPPWFFYAPIALYCLWLGLRYRGLTLPTAANPRIYAAGFLRESKSQILALVPEGQHRRVAHWTLLKRPGGRPRPEALRALAREAVEQAGLGYPLVAKPDIGQRGAGVRRIADEAELVAYLQHFPAGQGVILQKLIDLPLEAGVFYVRRPGESVGEIISVTLKRFPEVVGDGRSSLRELIEADPRAGIIADIYHHRHRARLDEVLAEGQRFPLVFAGNHCQGAVFENGLERLTPALRAGVLEFCQALPDFHIGRLDLRFESFEAIERGEGFQVIEVNGAGAEATHIWDARTRLGEAYRDLARQFRLLYEIGAANRSRGYHALTLSALGRDILFMRRLLRHYPAAS